MPDDDVIPVPGAPRPTFPAEELDPITDPDLDGIPATTILEDLAAELAAPAALDDELTLPVEGRPGWSAVFRLNIDARTELEKWRKAATKRGEVDGLKFAGIIIAQTNTALLKAGTVVTEAMLTDDGLDEPITFRAPPFQRLYDAPSAIEAIRRFYGRDGYLDGVAKAILEAAGFGDEVSPEDPT